MDLSRDFPSIHVINFVISLYLILLIGLQRDLNFFNPVLWQVSVAVSPRAILEGSKLSCYLITAIIIFKNECVQCVRFYNKLV
jgi:hypothetical protein